jgi:hypothetical protein
MKLFRVLYPWIVVILILGFSLTSVKADRQPISGILEDVGGAASKILDGGGFTLRQHNLIQPQEETITISEVSPQPISPSMEYVYDKTPKFLFSCNSEADKYKITVYDTGAPLYTFKGTGVCIDTEGCCLEPTTALSFSNLNRDPYKGFAYNWVVKAKINDVWQTEWSALSDEFWVISPGFTSTFTGNMNKWLAVNGTWLVVDAGYLKSQGMPGKWASVVRKEFFVDFDYTVRMKRKTSEASSNAIIVWGNSTPVTSNNEWDDGIYFAYNNNGQYATWYLFNGTKTMIQDWTDVPDYINEYDWNTLRVVADMPTLSFYINDHYLSAAEYLVDFPFEIMDGWVGIGLEKQDNGIKEPLSVDWVTLTSFQDNN